MFFSPRAAHLTMFIRPTWPKFLLIQVSCGTKIAYCLLTACLTTIVGDPVKRTPLSFRHKNRTPSAHVHVHGQLGHTNDAQRGQTRGDGEWVISWQMAWGKYCTIARRALVQYLREAVKAGLFPGQGALSAESGLGYDSRWCRQS